jgi:hypothetical protein
MLAETAGGWAGDSVRLYLFPFSAILTTYYYQHQKYIYVIF